MDCLREKESELERQRCGPGSAGSRARAVTDLERDGSVFGVDNACERHQLGIGFVDERTHLGERGVLFNVQQAAPIQASPIFPATAREA